MLVPINFGMGSEPDRHSPVPLYINCERNDAGEDAKFRYPAYAKHGLSDFATLSGGGGVRGMIKINNMAFVVSGQKLFSVDTTGNATQVAGIPGTDKVYMAANRRTDTQIVIVTDGLAYVLQNGVLSDYPDTDLPPPIALSFLNGNFVFFLPDGRMFSSELESTDIDALDFATAEADRDNCLAGIVRGDDIINFGSETIEYWRPDGGSNFPFSRVHTSQQGCMAGKSVAEYDGTVFWVSDRGVVLASRDYEGKDVSDNAVKRDIKDEPFKQDMTAFTYSHRGIGYYVLSGSSWTHILNLDTGFWHKAESYQLNKWRGLYSLKFANETIIGDATTNKLYIADSDVFTEGGNHLIWKIRTPINHKYPSRVAIKSLFLDFIPGQGDGSTSPDKSNPKASIKISRDGGNTFGGARLRNLGQQGQRNTQVRVNGLGLSKEDGFAIEVSVSTAVAGGITGAAADIGVKRP